jgi:hypothetical protein
MSRYAIWNKRDQVITPIGEVLTPEQWISRYPMANVLDIVIGGGAINGAYCMEYTSFKEMYEKEGCDFSQCVTKQDCLDAIEAFEDARNNQPIGVTDETRIADALEDLVVLSMPDVE